MTPLRYWKPRLMLVNVRQCAVRAATHSALSSSSPPPPMPSSPSSFFLAAPLVKHWSAASRAAEVGDDKGSGGGGAAAMATAGTNSPNVLCHLAHVVPGRCGMPRKTALHDLRSSDFLVRWMTASESLSSSSYMWFVKEEKIFFLRMGLLPHTIFVVSSSQFRKMFLPIVHWFAINSGALFFLFNFFPKALT